MSETSSQLSPTLESQTAYEVVEAVVASNPEIECINLVSYVEGPNWRDRVGGRCDPATLLSGLRQDEAKRVLTTMPRDEVSACNLEARAEALVDGRLLGILSRVVLKTGVEAHIPMMDFVCPPSPENLETLIFLLGGLRYGKGWVVESGRSYHFYGSKLVRGIDWNVFLGKCLLMSNYVDTRYIGHQLVDGHCVLRLSSGSLRSRVPTVVAHL
jgi:hypothetical protein